MLSPLGEHKDNWLVFCMCVGHKEHICSVMLLLLINHQKQHLWDCVVINGFDYPFFCFILVFVGHYCYHIELHNPKFPTGFQLRPVA